MFWLQRAVTFVLIIGAVLLALAGPRLYVIAVFWQATKLNDQGKYAEATVIAQRALTLAEHLLGEEDASTLSIMGNLAVLYQSQGHFGEAEPLYKRALEAQTRVRGKDHPNTLNTLNDLGVLYQDQGRYSEAKPLLRRALEARERTLGREHPDTLVSLNDLALLYKTLGLYSEAEPLYQRSLEASERALGKEHPGTLTTLNNLASLYTDQGRFSEAEPLFKRALEAQERVLGKESPYTLASVNNLAELYLDWGRYSEAEPLFKRVLKAAERVLGKEHPKTLFVINNLAQLYLRQGRYSEAEPLLRRALEVSERVLGREHPDTLESVNNLAFLYQVQGRFGEAEPLYKRALEAQERVLGKEHPDTLGSVNNLAGLYFTRRDWVRAAEFWRRSTAAIAGRERRGALAAGQAVTGKKKGEAGRLSFEFWFLVKAVYRLAPEGRAPDAIASREMFQTAQWAVGSETAQSLAQMAARGATGDLALARLARERQDLVAEWQKRDAQRILWLGQAPDKRDVKAEADNQARFNGIDARITEIDQQLAAKFPDYAALASPAPLAAEQVQTQLGAEEALVLFLDTDEWKPTPEETFIWVVTKTDMRWLRSDLGIKALAREVQALRCGLDAEAWADRQCADLTYTDADRDAGKPLPFDHARAFRLYQALFGQAEDLIKNKQLLLVPSGALTQLPFQVLVTATPASGDHRSTAWLIRDHALTVLPAVSSLKALRRVARPSAATKPMIGFGNPLLDGDPAKYPDDGRDAQLARTYNSCPIPASQRVASNKTSHKGVAPLATRGGLASVSQIRFQAPLPDTAIELCNVARDVHADPADIYLGARATELEVKELSKSGQLAQYRIVHFATHGALAGQVTGNSRARPHPNAAR